MHSTVVWLPKPEPSYYTECISGVEGLDLIISSDHKLPKALSFALVFRGLPKIDTNQIGPVFSFLVTIYILDHVSTRALDCKIIHFVPQPCVLSIDGYHASNGKSKLNNDLSTNGDVGFHFKMRGAVHSHQQRSLAVITTCITSCHDYRQESRPHRPPHCRIGQLSPPSSPTSPVSSWPSQCSSSPC